MADDLFIITDEQLHRLAYFADMLDVKSEIRSRTLSDELEESYKNGFNDGHVEGLPRPPCEECVYQAQSAGHDAKVAKAERESCVVAIKKELNDTDPNWKGMNKAIKIIESLRGGVKE